MKLNKKYYIIPIFVPHKGCPHDCIFCNQKRITGIEKDITYGEVVQTIDDYLKTINRENSYIEVSFFGGSFTGIPMDYQNELMQAAKEAYISGKIDGIRLSTRPDYINPYILDNLVKYNVGVIELGVQSMDDEVLRLSERGHSPEDVINASRLIKKYNIKLGLQMMLGLPGDSEEKDLYTANEIIKLKPDFVRIYPALVIRDTYMEYMYKGGLYKPLSIDEAVEISKKLYIEFISENIKVIRIGLQPTEEINTGRDVISGPFHPAFRELVESTILNDMIGFVINKHFINSEKLEISVNPYDISKLYANGKRIFYNKMKCYMSINIKIRQDYNCKKGTIALDDGEKQIMMSTNEYVNIVKKRRNFKENIEL
ncbi:MAG: radical protein [Clostridiales bacterium]|jgi:histone acetyltransferase (RNA polymerase elongator complex component)|nr:radical protein [Clostridiales bacterium]